LVLLKGQKRKADDSITAFTDITKHKINISLKQQCCLLLIGNNPSPLRPSTDVHQLNKLMPNNIYTQHESRKTVDHSREIFIGQQL